jgi:hypothetical protein
MKDIDSRGSKYAEMHEPFRVALCTVIPLTLPDILIYFVPLTVQGLTPSGHMSAVGAEIM